MANSLKQLQNIEKQKKAKIKKLDAELRKEKQALASVQKQIQVLRKKEAAAAAKKRADAAKKRSGKKKGGKKKPKTKKRI